MGLKQRIKNGVKAAFAALDDLVYEGTLESESPTGFNFSAGETNTSNASKVVKIAMLEESKVEEGASFKAIILKSDGVIVNTGDLITVDTVKYRVSKPVDNSYTIECNLTAGG